MSAPQALQQVLALVVPQLREHCRDAWTVIGSAAAILCGAKVEAADLDLLTSRADAERLRVLWADVLDRSYRPADAARFRSHFARFRFAALPVEVMGELELHGLQGWQPVRVHEIVLVNGAGVEIPVPTPAEQIRILESFGRPKDLQRAALLRAV